MRLELHNQCLTVKLSRTQMRRCKAIARGQGKRAGVWARELLLAAVEEFESLSARKKNGHASNGKLAAPVLPARSVRA